MPARPEPAPAGVSARSTHDDLALYEVALEGTGSFRGARLLDVGCGRGSLLRLLAERGGVATGVDCFAGSVRAAAAQAARASSPGRAHVVEGDAHHLPFAARAFTGATSFLTLHQLRDPALALAEVRRVLEPEGWFLLADRVTEEGARRKDRDALERTRSGRFRQLYTPAELRALCAVAGLEVASETEYERRLPLAAWLAAVPEGGRAALHAEVEALARTACLRTLRVVGTDVVLGGVILRCQTREQ